MNTPDPKAGKRPIKLDRTVIDPQRPSSEPSTVVDAIKLGPGLRIEQYELIRELGRGGMGQVFLARDTRLGRRVAMKFLAANSPRFTERFLVEAKATARCSHEHIVVIHDVDEYLGLPYMVLEYIEGLPLGALITEKRLPAARVIELITPVVKALACAHAANIIHRDLKPDNIIVTASGTVKVLDFGIAKLFASPDEPRPRRPPTPGENVSSTRSGAIVGTLPYMSPEQLGTDEVDHRSDLWAVGIIMYEMLAGKHPLEPVTQGRLFGAAAALDEPMPPIGGDVAGLPDRLERIVDRCLAKHKTERYASAAELLADLEPLLPSRAGRNLVADESPFPGLNAFQESDANRFFGRSQDIAGTVARLRDQPLVGVVGPSGVGKSSFVRAGVVPALKASGDPWEVLIVRPGRHPLAALAGSLEALRDSRDSDPVIGDDPATRLRSEPGLFGARLRARARRKRSQILLFVDQQEELYTLVTDASERRAFTACLAGAADDPSGPLRVIVAMRSDFLDRAAEDRQFVEELTRGLVFLQPPNRAGLEEALTQPLDMLGYGYEPGVVHGMLETLETTQGPLPLLQFTAAKLWDTRDKTRRILTLHSYLALGGVAGALATHADEVLAAFSARDQKLVRAIFQRLVTPERTRAIVEVSDMRDIASDVDRIIGLLVGARLIVVHTRGDGDGATAVELVHESLIKSWPILQRWLDENQDDAAYLAQLRAAAKQWDQKGRAPGLLWRNEAMDEARLWRARYQRELPAREQDFLDAVFELATRATRLKRRLVVGAFVFLLAVVAAAGVALVQIRNAEKVARDNEAKAKQAEIQAEAAKQAVEQDAAVLASSKATILRQLEELRTKEAAREQAILKEKQAAESEKLALERAQASRTEAEKKTAALLVEKQRTTVAKQKLDEAERDKKNRASKITNGLK
jgi:serine/threonine protein kinase